MRLQELKDSSIKEAVKYINEKGIPAKNQSMKYSFVADDGSKYPPKYLYAVARHLEKNVPIITDDYNAVEAKKYFVDHGYNIEEKSEKYELTITSDSVISTDSSFDINNLGLGDKYKPLDVWFEDAEGGIVRRNYLKGERKITNQTIAKLAFQIYEQRILSLSILEMERFPVCQYRPTDPMIYGIYSNVDDYKAKCRNSMEYMTYKSDNGSRFVIYAWNVFSTIVFVQECLKRYGSVGDKFVLTYREKEEKEIELEDQESIQDGMNEKKFTGYLNPYSTMLIQSKNIIFRGAPGTGKSYLAKEIAADIISDGYYDDFNMLSDEQKEQVEFVQFHPSYDYSDFVEGLRPKMNEDGSIGFELQDGIFKRFVEKARRNYENSQKTIEVIEKESSVQDAIAQFLDDEVLVGKDYSTISGRKFRIDSVDEGHIRIFIPDNPIVKNISLSIEKMRIMLESEEGFEKRGDIARFFGKKYESQEDSYYIILFKTIKELLKNHKKTVYKQEELKKYIFIIDEINRGEISKILGELFFSIDPGYRGEAGSVSTQYSNMHENPDDKFYIPDNVYIIGTMNDIDRSVDSFDFAMRRRFRFIEVKADERLEMLSLLGDEELEKKAIQKMTALNKVIIEVEDLNENYQIGASYFLKLKSLSFDELWTDNLKPLLQDYIQGMYDEKGIMQKFAKAYGYVDALEGTVDEGTQY